MITHAYALRGLSIAATFPEESSCLPLQSTGFLTLFGHLAVIHPVKKLSPLKSRGGFCILSYFPDASRMHRRSRGTAAAGGLALR